MKHKLTILIALNFLLVPWAADAGPVRGRFQYGDVNPNTGDSTLRPAVGVRVEVHSNRPRLLDTVWWWDLDATLTTDATGFFSFQTEDVTGVEYEIKVFAENSAAVVRPFNALLPETFSRSIRRTVTNPNAVIDVTQNFIDPLVARHFNLAETMRRGFIYANARRDPDESDSIGKVIVLPTSHIENSFFNPTPLAETLMIHQKHVFDDATILHEYGHLLEHRIGSFFAQPSHHNGCLATATDNQDIILNSPQHAWMEGFADFFSLAVMRSAPGAFNSGPDSGTFSEGALETPKSCSQVPPTVLRDAVEVDVAAVLFDLMDGPDGDEPHDKLSNFDTTIFQIMDHEMDTGLDFPDIHDFIRAWRGRGLPFAELQRIVFTDMPGFGFTFDAPPNQTVEIDGASCGARVEYPNPTLQGTVPTGSITCTPPSGSFFRLGSTAVTCVLKDAGEELDRVTFLVSVFAPPYQSPGGPGLMGTYFDTMNFSAPAFQRLDSSVNFDFRTGSPDPRIAADSFSVRWEGFFIAPYTDTYTFTTRADDAVQLFIGEQLVINQAERGQITETSGSIQLHAGESYPIRVDYSENTGNASIQLFYASDCIARQIVPTERLFPPPTGTGLAATYYSTADDSVPLLTRVDAKVDFTWGNRAPVAGTLNGSFHARWTGKVWPECSGDYTFFTFTSRGARLVVDGRVLIDGLNTAPNAEQSGRIHLEQGRLYDLSLEVQEDAGNAAARLSWSGPCTPKATIPTTRLFPFFDQQSRPAMAFGSQWELTGHRYALSLNLPFNPSPFVAFDFVAQPVHGDGEIVARVSSLTGLAGLMIRDNWTTAGREVFIGLNPSGEGVFWKSSGLNTHQTTALGSGFTTPRWLKLNRCGERVTASASIDGATWEVLAVETVPLAATAWFGLAVQGVPSLGPPIGPFQGALPKARFDHVSIGSTAGCSCLLGSGLLGAYFDRADLTAPRFRRIDPAINFVWNDNPDLQLGTDTFSVRWTGTIVARSSETHTFYARVDGGVRLYIDGRLIIDQWNNQASTEFQGTMALRAGQAHDLRMEFSKNGVGGRAQLRWSNSSIGRQLVTPADFHPLTPSAMDIPRLVNTGVDDAGAPLPDNRKEWHYTASVNGGQTTTPYVARAASGSPTGPWLADNQTSAWISPAANTLVAPDAVTRYDLYFNLTSLEASTACIVGRWAADGAEVEIQLNGRTIPQSARPTFDAWTDFAVLDHFATRDNVLSFVVRNDSSTRSSSGLRVEICGKIIPHCFELDSLTPGPVSNPWLFQGTRFAMASASGHPWSNPEIRSEVTPGGQTFAGLNFGGRVEIDLPEPCLIARVTLIRAASAPTVTAYDVNGRQLNSVTMTAAEGVAQSLDLLGRGITRLVVTAPNNEVFLLGVCLWPERVLEIRNMTRTASGTTVSIYAVPGRTYCLQYRDLLREPWQNAQCIEARAIDLTLTDSTAGTGPARVYRVVEMP